MKLLLAAGVVGVVGIGVYAIASGTGLQSATAQAGGRLAADLVPVNRMHFDITTTATGELQARNQIELRSELESEANLVELISEGMLVKKGEQLFRLNTDQLQTQIDETMLRVESARADHVAAQSSLAIQKSENESLIRQAELKLEIAKLALDQWEKGEHVQKLNDIKLALEKTERDLTRLLEKVEYSLKLYAEGFLSKDQKQQEEIALEEAKAARKRAELEEKTYLEYQEIKDRKTKTSDVEEARAELDRQKQQAQIQVSIKDADLLNKRRQLQLQEEKLARLQRQVAAATVVAPQDGLVVYATSAGRNWMDDSPFAVGRRVRPQETLIVLPDTSEMIAAVRVHESLAGRIRPGQPATVKIDAIGGRVFAGRVDSISVMAESQDRWRDPNRREYTVKIALDRVASDSNLKPAMRCEATVSLGYVEDALAIPLQAIFADDAVRFVYTPRGGKYVRVPVKIGRRSDTYAEITAGLTDDQRVLVREPDTGEILQTQWDPAQLKLVGFDIGSDGKPVSTGGGEEQFGGFGRRGPGGPGGPGGMSGGRGSGSPESRSPGAGSDGERDASAGARRERPSGEQRRTRDESASTEAKAEPKQDPKPEAAPAEPAPAPQGVSTTPQTSK